MLRMFVPYPYGYPVYNNQLPHQHQLPHAHPHPHALHPQHHHLSSHIGAPQGQPSQQPPGPPPAQLINRWPSLPVLHNPYVVQSQPAPPPQPQPQPQAQLIYSTYQPHHHASQYLSPSPTVDPHTYIVPQQYSCYQPRWPTQSPSSQALNSLCSVDSGVDLNQTDPTLPDDISLDFSFSSSSKDTEPHGDIWSARASPISNCDDQDQFNTAFDEGARNDDRLYSRMDYDEYDENELLEILYMNGCPRNLAKSRCRSV